MAASVKPASQRHRRRPLTTAMMLSPARRAAKINSSFSAMSRTSSSIFLLPALLLSLVVSALMLPPVVAASSRQHRRLADSTDSVPCVERGRAYRLPDGCRCRIDARDNGTEVDCDGVVFVGDFPLLPFRHRIHSFRQRGVGHQTLAAQIFTASDVPLKRVDFSDNELARLSERIFDGIEDTIEEIRLGGNKLGDQLNPIFSTNELRNLKRLKYLDLSRNMIKGIEDGILTGCHNLHTLELEGNDLQRIPTGALKGPKALKSLNLAFNRLDLLPQNSLKEQAQLERLNLTGNTIAIIQPMALINLKNLKRLDLSGNHLSKIPGGALDGLENLEELDLSDNFLSAIPVEALTPLKSLRRLIIHSNRIKQVEEADIRQLSKQLEYLDLSRNGLEKVPPRTFSPVPGLKVLKLNINVIRKVEDDSFEGLDQLSEIDLSDNSILFLPTSALGRLTSLSKLTMDYNRIGVLSPETLASFKNVEQLSLAYNLIRDVPDGTFKAFNRLKRLNLRGNQIEAITQDTLSGLERTLVEADFSFNALSSVSKMSFPKLNHLDLSRNNISRLQEEAFGVLTSLKYLNLSDNNLERIHAKAFKQPGDNGPLALEVLDLSKNVIRDVQPGSFESQTLMALDMHANMLKEITNGVFVDMPELRFLDLSANDIYSVKPGSFDKLKKLQVLKLDKNNLASFKEESFTGVTEVEEISLNSNQITYLLSDAFVKHPKLRKLELAHNRLNAFPGEIVRGIRPLEELTLAHNSLKTLDNLDFANIPNLRSLDLSHNQIGFVGEASLQNSTQIQFLDLSYNKIKELPDNAFLGVGRLLLNLEGNQLTSLPPSIFDRNKLYQLQSINLARNALESIPVDALSRQYFFLQEVDFSHNEIADIQSNANILVNIKKLDLSYNPLTAESIDYILNEPKTARDLNMAGTGIKRVPVLETPFLRKLNLSDNEIDSLNEDMFQRPTLLEVLDVSKNKIPNLSFGLASIWPKLTDLRDVRLSHNPVNYIIKGDFAYLANLEVLEIDDLPECTKIEKGAFAGLRKVTQLAMHTYPKVGFLDTKGILAQFRAPKSVSVEVKNSVVGDDLHTAFSPRLEKLEMTGKQVRSVSTGAFAGINSPKIDIRIYNTTVPSLPSPVFFPVPMSSHVTFDVTDNEIVSLSPQLLSTLEDKQRQIKLKGLGSNPIYCDCNTRPLKKWLLAQQAERRLAEELEQITCQQPEQNKGKKLVEISDADLSCQGATTTTTTSEIPFTTLSTTERSEPDIIWTVDPTQPTEKIKAAQAAKNEATRKRDKMDHLIFGILGGVIAFILVLVFIICLVRLRFSDSHYPGGPLVGPLALQAAPQSMHTLPNGKCTCIKPPPPQPYLYYPPPMTPLPPPSMGGTLPKMLPPPPPPSAHSIYGSLHRSRGGYYANPPYYVTFPNESGMNPGCDNRGSQSPYEC